MIRAVLSSAVAATMLTAPVVAQAETRAAAPLESSEAIAANPWIPWLVAIAAALAIILVISDDSPSSP